MAASTTLTIRISPELKAKLTRLAAGTQRSGSFLAAQAVSRYVDRELEIVEGIMRGMADVRAGNTVSHEQAMAEIWAMLDDRKAQAS